MAEISWGKCTIAVGKYPDTATEYDFTAMGTGFAVANTPVNGSTTINIEDGEKHEAEIEGGGNEAVKYDEDKFSLEFDIRRAKGRKLIAGGAKIGQVDGTFCIGVQPENPAAPSILIEAASLKRALSYKSTDGIYDHYVFDALVPKVGEAVKIGQLAMGVMNVRETTDIAICTAIVGDVNGRCNGLVFHEESESIL